MLNFIRNPAEKIRIHGIFTHILQEEFHQIDFNSDQLAKVNIVQTINIRLKINYKYCVCKIWSIEFEFCRV